MSSLEQDPSYAAVVVVDAGEIISTLQRSQSC